VEIAWVRSVVYFSSSSQARQKKETNGARWGCSRGNEILPWHQETLGNNHANQERNWTKRWEGGSERTHLRGWVNSGILF
jgi:hypothetical protein